MVERVIKIVANTAEATKEINDLFNTMVKQEKEAQKQSEKTADAVADIGKASKQTSKDVNIIKKGFSSLGIAMKAAGIGLVISAMDAMKDIFSQNQRVVDAVSTGFETMSIVINQLVSGVINVYDAVAKSTENFNGLQNVMSGLVTIALTPMRLAFYNIKLALQTAQLAWEQSFFGGKDADKILQLNKDITETQKSIMGVGVDALNAGKDIINNFSDAVGEIGNIGSLAADELSKISIKSAFEQAKMNVELKNTAELAAAQQGLLITKLEAQAEAQRKIRDDVSKSISVRKQANDELLKITEKSNEALKKQANLQIDAAQAQFDKTGKIEDEVALIEQLTNKQDLLNQIQAQQIEQNVNKVALLQEEYDLNIAISDGENERRLAQLQFEEEMAETEVQKLKKQKEKLELEQAMLLADIEAKREIYAEGTQARVDAENEYALRKQEIDNLISKNSQNIAKEEARLADERIKLEESVAQAKRNIASRTADLLIQLGGKAAKVGKAIAVAQTIRSGIEGVQSAYTTAQKSPITTLFPAYPYAQAALAGAFSALQLREMLKTPDTGGGSAPSSATTGSTPQPQTAPSFNIVEGTGSNQIAESIANQNRPLKAFVVSSDVTNAQELDRNIIENSKF